MGVLLSCFRNRTRRKLTLMLAGLDNAGKTLAGLGLAGGTGKLMGSTAPTIGFSIINLLYGNYDVKIYDLGGSSVIRGIWHKYFGDVHGVIFVIDASDMTRIDEAKLVLETLLMNEKIAGKPILLLANKQDYADALDEIEVIEKLELELLVNNRKCPTLVECCSASDTNGKQEPGIKRGYEWIVNYIVTHYEEIDSRVQKDVQQQKHIDEALLKQQLKKMEYQKQNYIVNNAIENCVKNDSCIVNKIFYPASTNPVFLLVQEQLILSSSKKLSRVSNSKNKIYPMRIYDFKRCSSSRSLSRIHHAQQKRFKSAGDKSTGLFKVSDWC